MLNRRAFRTAFNFYEARLNALEDSPAWWEETVRQMDELDSGDPLLQGLLVAVHAELERVAHEQQGKGQRRGA